MFISMTRDFYRCMACGGDLEQKINGVIKYIPVDGPIDRPKVDG